MNNTNKYNLLTPRESEIKNLVCLGLSNKEIGNELNITEKTVKAYLTEVFQKENVKNRVNLIIKSYNTHVVKEVIL